MKTKLSLLMMLVAAVTLAAGYNPVMARNVKGVKEIQAIPNINSIE